MERHRIGTFTSGGRFTSLLDVNDGAEIRVREFKVTPSEKQALFPAASRRYGGSRKAGEVHGNGQLVVSWILRDDSADDVLARWDELAALLESARADLFYEWRPGEASRSTYFQIRGGLPADWDYVWWQFNREVLQLQAGFVVAPLAYGDRMDVHDDFSTDTIGAGDWTFDAGEADVDAEVSGGVLAALGTAPFSPLDLSPSLWLDVDNSGGLADGASISTYPDSSGNSNTLTQGTAPFRPTFETGEINGKSVVRYTGNEVYLESPASAAVKPFTVAAVVKATDFADNRTLIGSSVAGGIHIRINQTTGMPQLNRRDVSGIGTATTALVAGTAAVVLVTYSAAGAYAFYINGAAAGSGTNDQTFTASTAMLGASPGNAAEFLGDMGDVILIPSLVTTDQRNSLTAYLGTKFGITVV